MRFLADESCDFAVVRILREAGHDVATVRDLARGATDNVVIDLAARENRILLTEDKDFGQLVYVHAAVYETNRPGVIFIRFPGSARQALAGAILQLVAMGEEKIKGRFIVVQPGRIRVT